jgi:hypothetical protein
MSVLKLPLLVELQQKVGELVLSVTSCPETIILETDLNQYVKNVVMVALTRDIMFLLLTCTHFWVGGILRRWSACGRPHMKWSAFIESFRNTDLEQHRHLSTTRS